MNYRSMAKSASTRRAKLQDRISATKKDLESMETELVTLDKILAAVSSAGTKVEKVSRGAPRRKGGKWRKGHPGRPPKWFTEQQKAKTKAKRPAKPAKAAKAKKVAKPAMKPVKKPRRKRTVTAEQLAGLARARAALAAKRAAASSGVQAPLKSL